MRNFFKMQPINIWVQKKYELNPDFRRYYTKAKIQIDINSWIQNEAQLCWWIYRNCGVGRYLLLATQKGKKGFWNFWLGYCLSNGWIRDVRKRDEYSDDEKPKRRGPKHIQVLKPGILYPYY